MTRLGLWSLVLGVVMTSCEGAPACGATTCKGCCTEWGECVGGATNDACGADGQMCMRCQLGDQCSTGVNRCVFGGTVAGGGSAVGPVSDGGVDLLDAGLLDAGFLDAGFLDAGFLDAGFLDAGFLDAGGLDAGGLDAGGLSDAGPRDAGMLDAIDASVRDAGLTDGGLNDAGTVGSAVLLYTGANGGTPASDLYPNAVQALYADAGIPVQLAATVPSDFATRFGVIVFLNPRAAVATDVRLAANDLVQRGGRVVLIMEHCKNGCWGNAQECNALLASLGSNLTFSGQGGAPLSPTSLVITPVPPLTDGVNQLIVYYSGSVTGGASLGTVSGGDSVIRYQRLGRGDVVAIADSSMFGYVLNSGSNRRFIANLGIPLR